MGFAGWAGQVARCAACLFAPRVWDAGGQVMRDTYSKWDNGAAICRNVLGRFIWDPICHCTAVAWQDGMQGRGNNAGCALKMAHFLPAQRWVAAWGCVLRVLRAMQGGIMLKTHENPCAACQRSEWRGAWRCAMRVPYWGQCARSVLCAVPRGAAHGSLFTWAFRHPHGFRQTASFRGRYVGVHIVQPAFGRWTGGVAPIAPTALCGGKGGGPQCAAVGCRLGQGSKSEKDTCRQGRSVV